MPGFRTKESNSAVRKNTIATKKRKMLFSVSSLPKENPCITKIISRNKHAKYHAKYPTLIPLCGACSV